MTEEHHDSIDTGCSKHRIDKPVSKEWRGKVIYEDNLQVWKKQNFVQ